MPAPCMPSKIISEDVNHFCRVKLWDLTKNTQTKQKHINVNCWKIWKRCQVWVQTEPRPRSRCRTKDLFARKKRYLIKITPKCLGGEKKGQWHLEGKKRVNTKSFNTGGEAGFTYRQNRTGTLTWKSCGIGESVAVVLVLELIAGNREQVKGMRRSWKPASPLNEALKP